MRATGASSRALCVEVWRHARRLLLFREVLADDVGVAYLETLGALASGRAEAAFEAYARLFALLADATTGLADDPVGDAWQNHLLDRLLTDDNPLSRRARLAPLEPPGEALLAAARGDLRILRRAFDLAGDRVAAEVARAGVSDGDSPPEVVSWAGLQPIRATPGRSASAVSRMKALLASSDDWGELVGELVQHYAAVGAGIFARYRAFRWVRESGRGELQGIANPDPITLEELVGYDAEREILLRNTEQFLAGYPANNVLVYGDRGTGKSSTIKALLNAGADRGLRLVEVPKQQLSDFPDIAARLRGRPERFVLFVDDLSFDEHETQYKELKAVLEGGLEARPENVLVYATSNRRHLVQERFGDRAEPGGEVHGQDAVQEKLSLSDRFGITITFEAPDQERYLRIVTALARRRGLALPPAELQTRALQWAAWHNGRSGRCARQFVDHLAGEMGLRR